MITEDYVSFETAKLLKEKGFDELTYACFSNDGKETYYGYRQVGNDINRPTLQMAMKWLREVHHIFIDIISRFSKNADNDICFSYSCKKLTDKYEIVDGEWLCYEEVCEAAVKYCLENFI